MKRLVYFSILFILPFFLWQCENIKDWTQEEKDSVAPGKVTGVTVTNIPGGALIAYTRPADKDLLAVKALYSFTENGKIQEAYASAYSNEIWLEGFPDTEKRSVKLICIDKSLNESESTEVIIEPLTPPVEQIRQSLTIEAVFGGVLVSWENPTRTPIGIALYAADPANEGKMKWDYTYYTNAASGKYAFRGHTPIETQFQVLIRDKWENYSQPLNATLKPLVEVPITGRDANNNNIWARYGFSFVQGQVSADPECIFRGDMPRQYNANEGIDKLNDGHAGDANNNSRWLHTGEGNNLLSYYTGNTADNMTMIPMYLTIDLTLPCKLSRHRLFHRGTAPLGGQNLRHYELWGTAQKPKSMADFTDEEGNYDRMASLAYWTSWEEVGGQDTWKTDGWVKLADCWTYAPVTGTLKLDEVTAADKQYALEHGFDFDILPEQTGTTVRYLRIVSDRTWSEGSTMHIGEFQLWGDYVH